MEQRSQRSGGGGGWLVALALGAGALGAAWYFLARPTRPRRRSLPQPPIAARPPMIHHPPSQLRDSILGADKQMVQAVFGPPRAAGGVPAVPDQGRQAYWDADTWYYALDPKRKTAMAIRFENGIAREVDFVQG